MSKLIFGHTWEEINNAQRGGSLSRSIVTHQPNPTATQADVDLLVKLGYEELERQQLFGVIDRLKTSGFIA